MHYQRPELIELGNIEELTRWRVLGIYDDGLGQYTYSH